MSGFMFNIDGGYLEGLCRGFKCGILKQSDYLNLVQCETLEGKYCYSDKIPPFQGSKVNLLLWSCDSYHKIVDKGKKSIISFSLACFRS